MSTSSSKKRGPFRRTDWFVALLVTLAVLMLHQLTDTIGALERRLYDYGSTSGGRQPSDRIAVIAIDDQSVAKIGRWPRARDVHAPLIDQRAAAKAKTIVYGGPHAEAAGRPGGAPGYDAPEAVPARPSAAFEKTNVMSRPARHEGPDAGDAKTDLEARPSKL